MNKLLKPAIMQSILTHDQTYRRAVGILNESWGPDRQPIYREVLEARDIAVARQLQRSELIRGRVDLDSYQAVSQLLARHPQWFAQSARRTLLAPFQD